MPFVKAYIVANRSRSGPQPFKRWLQILRLCLFASDLHGQVAHYEKLFKRIKRDRPAAVFLGGDLLPSGMAAIAGLSLGHKDFINEFLAPGFAGLRERLAENYPDIFVILGNDDSRFEEAAMLDVAARGLWHYMHERSCLLGPNRVYGYACVPPSPFQLKDWERYDVSRHVDPGCVPPTAGMRTVPVDDHEIKYGTIKGDLERLTSDDDLERAVFLFHSPPYESNLDRAALDGKMVDYVPLDVHVGSIAIRRFIQKRQPLLTLHGHVHESACLTGAWQEQIGRTRCLGAAQAGPEMALVSFDIDRPDDARRELL